jgi:hypothetical protein
MVHFEGLKISSTLGMNIYLKRRTEEGGRGYRDQRPVVISQAKLSPRDEDPPFYRECLDASLLV